VLFLGEICSNIVNFNLEQMSPTRSPKEPSLFSVQIVVGGEEECMINLTNESTASALEEAAMDLISTSNSNSEPIEPERSTINSTIASNSNGSSTQTSNEVESTDIPSAEAINPMEEKTSNNVSAVYGNYEDYQLLPDAPWPPPIFVKQKISPQERYYIEHRWYSQWSFFDSKATQNKNRYYRTQLIVGLGSVTVPVLVGIKSTDALADSVLYIVTVIISLAVAMSTAIESLYTFGDNWRSYRSAAEDLHQEKSLYDVKAGRYANNPQGFLRFVERCEEIIAQQNGRWVQSQEKAAEQVAEQASEFLDPTGSSADKDDIPSVDITPIASAPVQAVATETYVDPTPADPSSTDIG
jgi:hypothetical protein